MGICPFSSSSSQSPQTLYDAMEPLNTQVLDPHNPTFYGNFTAAMIWAYRHGLPPAMLYHDPSIYSRDDQHMTVAYILRLYHKIDPPPEWWHDPNYRDTRGNTVAHLYYDQLPPKQWEHDPTFKEQAGHTVAMQIALNLSCVPPPQWEHDPALSTNYQRWTVAMLLAHANPTLTIPLQWRHDPEQQDFNGDTVAMVYVCRSEYPPPEWWHNSTLKNDHGMTVAMLMANMLFMNIPEEWEHDKKLTSDSGRTVADYYREGFERCGKINEYVIPPQWL